MMMRFLAIVGASVLAIASSVGLVSAQTDTPVNADGTFVVASDNGAPIASGAGQDIVYGDINTGGGGGEVLGDPNAVYASPRPEHPGRGEMIVMPGAGDGMIGGVPIMPPLQPAAPDNSTTTTTSLDSTNGNTSDTVPLDTSTTSDSTTAATDSEATDTGATDTGATDGSATDSGTTDSGTTDSGTTDAGFCASYTTWYDAQVAYEDLGATDADPALVQEVDPDYDGIACEAMMQ